MTETYRQKDQGFLTYPAGGWRKAMFQWPVQLWRLGLGPLIGHNMVLISHTGRKTGITRRTMTELHEVDGHQYSPSGFGRRSQWYRNIEVDPRVTIQTAAGAQSALAVRVTDDDELLTILDLSHPINRMMTEKFLASLEIDPRPEDILAKKERIYYLRFDPTTEPTPAPLPADLVWLWPVGLAMLILIWLLARSK